MLLPDIDKKGTINEPKTAEATLSCGGRGRAKPLEKPVAIAEPNLLPPKIEANTGTCSAIAVGTWEIISPAAPRTPSCSKVFPTASKLAPGRSVIFSCLRIPLTAASSPLVNGASKAVSALPKKRLVPPDRDSKKLPTPASGSKDFMP